MRVMLEWSVGGTFAGAGMGFLIWLTDPGRPGNRLSSQLALGAAWGTALGAAVGLSRLNSGLIPPIVQNLEPGPLHPANRISSDPIRDEDERADLLASLTGSRGDEGPGLMVPVLNFRF